MNKILIYVLSIFITVSGTWVANRYQLKKAVKPYKKHIERLQADSTLKLKKIAYLAENLTLKSNSDSIKGEFIGQMQKTMQDISKINNALKADTTAQGIELADLKAYILASADGVVTDSVTVIKRFLRKQKVTRIRK